MPLIAIGSLCIAPGQSLFPQDPSLPGLIDITPELHGATPDQPFPQEQTFSLARTLAHGDREFAMHILQEYPKLHPKKQNELDESLLNAMEHGFENVASKLLSLGASPNASLTSGATPLHCLVKYTTYEAQVQLAQFLFSYHANPNLQDWRGDTPLHKATRKVDIRTYTKIK